MNAGTASSLYDPSSVATYNFPNVHGYQTRMEVT